MVKEKYKVTGMTCASCSSHVEKAVRSLHGVKNCEVNLMMENMIVEYDDTLTKNDIITAVENAGYGASLIGGDVKQNKSISQVDEKKTKSSVIRLILSLLLLVPLFYISMAYMTMGNWNWPLGVFGDNAFFVGLTEMILALAIMLLNYRFFVSGFKSLFHGGPNMDTLVAMGSTIAFIYSFAMMFVMSYYAKDNDWDKVMVYSMNLSFETCGMVPTLISIGKTLETYSKGKTTSAIRSLLDLAPKTAHLIKGDKVIDVELNAVRVDDVFLVKPGEHIPVDGIVLSGSSAVDESALTGESLPIDKNENDIVSSATLNKNGTLTCKATKVGNDTTLSQIVKMVEEASGTKTKISTIADKVAGIFVPIVLTIALIVFIFWFVFGKDYVINSGMEVTLLSYSIERAIAVLVISCPCSLGLATPVAIMVGNGKGAKNGILFKNAMSMEETGKCDYVVLDKTGTITEGKMKVDSIFVADSSSKDELLSIACSLERMSGHPLSKAINSYGEENKIVLSEVDEFITLPGYGIQGKIDNTLCYGGNLKMIEEKMTIDKKTLSFVEKIASEGKTPILFVGNNRLLGAIAVADTIKEDSINAIEKMKEEGLKVIMLTGDNQKTASYIADQVKVDAFVSDVLPDGKQKVIQELKKYGNVMMVGDGINDAPALTTADIGVAIGAGSDIAIDSADVVLMKSSLLDALKAIRLSRHTFMNIKENLFWAFFYNIIMIPVAAGVFSAAGLGKMKPWMGAAMMSLSSVTVVLNALRINLFDLNKDRKKRKPKELPDFLNKDWANENDKTLITITLSVDEMMCENCVSHVKKTLLSVNGVKDAKVSLENKEAVVKCVDICSIDEMIKKVSDEGYPCKEKEQGGK